MKLTKEELAERDKHVTELEKAAEEVQAAVSEYNTNMSSEWQKVNTAIEAYNNCVCDAESFINDIASRIDGEMDEKSERWRESDKGQLVEGWKNDIENIDVTPLEIEEPEEIDEPDMALAQDLTDMQEQPE